MGAIIGCDKKGDFVGVFFEEDEKSCCKIPGR